MARKKQSMHASSRRRQQVNDGAGSSIPALRAKVGGRNRLPGVHDVVAAANIRGPMIW
jgi:hypothetical protein